ncbi:VF530 family DNA-binding protein [Agarivorans sp. QJM3NY_29]|uniref:VF530 family protein n=1 Tax=unclassified Agarivorans TaxID=2636026 RepID=UPI003D7E8F0F
MSNPYHNNPLHGLKLEVLLDEIVAHYGWETLAFAMNMNCFRNKPDLDSCLKFLHKTKWAREKVEAFYLYRFKHLPRPDDRQYALPPRERIIPSEQKPRAPVVIDMSAPAQPQNKPKSKRSAKAKVSAQGNAPYKSRDVNPRVDDDKPFDPWAASR